MRVPNSAVGIILLSSGVACAKSPFEQAVEVIQNPKKAIDHLVSVAKTAPVEARSRLYAELARNTQNVRNLKGGGAAEEQWGTAGRIAFPIAAQTMHARSPNGEDLEFWLKVRLAHDYGNLVHKVQIHYGVTPLDEWAYQNTKWVAETFKIPIGNLNTEAQTYGYDIYVRSRRCDLSTDALVALLAHELMHSVQFERWGGSYSNFGYHYFKEFKRANLVYKNNLLETEAFQAQSRVANQKPKALDANGGGRFYFNTDLKTNDNLLWKVTVVDAHHVMIAPKVKESIALDANGGTRPYLGNSQLPNDNILFKIESHGRYVTLLPKVRCGFALDANGGGNDSDGAKTYFNKYLLPNDNLLWDVVPYDGTYFVILPKVR